MPRAKIRSVTSGLPRTVAQESTPPLKKVATRPRCPASDAGRTGALTSTSRSGGRPNGHCEDQNRCSAWNSGWLRRSRALIGPSIARIPPWLIAGISIVGRTGSAEGSTGVGLRNQSRCS